MENFICNWYGERLHTLNTKNTKIYLHFLPYLLNICTKLTFLISQGSVAQCKCKWTVHVCLQCCKLCSFHNNNWPFTFQIQTNMTDGYWLHRHDLVEWWNRRQTALLMTIFPTHIILTRQSLVTLHHQYSFVKVTIDAKEENEQK